MKKKNRFFKSLRFRILIILVILGIVPSVIAVSYTHLKEGDFTLPSMLDGMKEYIEQGKMTDYQDHYYPAEMAVDAMIQTYLMNQDTDAWLKKFDSDWKRYNRCLLYTSRCV